MTINRVVLLVLALLFAVFVIQNAQVVEVRFLFWGTQASRALVLVGTFFLGIIVGWFTSWFRKKEKPASKPAQS